jgi:uncharacterized protein (TIGR02271 family)
MSSSESMHEHPGGDQPHRHTEGDELATHDTGQERGSMGGARQRSEETLQLREEELQARKQSVEAGEVRIGKEVVEERRTMDVPVSREEVTVERRPVNRQPSDTPIGAEDETIRVPIREERVEVEKRPVVTEEISIGKQTVQETQQVSGTVRREEARIEGEGDVEMEGRR